MDFDRVIQQVRGSHERYLLVQARAYGAEARRVIGDRLTPIETIALLLLDNGQLLAEARRAVAETRQARQLQLVTDREAERGRGFSKREAEDNAMASADVAALTERVNDAQEALDRAIATRDVLSAYVVSRTEVDLSDREGTEERFGPEVSV